VCFPVIGVFIQNGKSYVPTASCPRVGRFGSHIPSRAQHMNEKDAPCAGRCRNCGPLKLSAVYNKIRDKLEPADAERLSAAERLWIQPRDANCSAERALYAGGIASAPAHLSCLEAKTRARLRSRVKLGPTSGPPKDPLFLRLWLGSRLAAGRNDVLQPHVGDEVAVVFRIVREVDRQHT
jgi:uncharacterized protein YecT (DUF1311 family)